MSVPVIVTGNLGYLGPIVVKKLRDQGAVVLGVDTNFYPVDLPYEYTADYQVASLDQAPRAFWEPKAVLHLAAISNDPMGELNPALTYQTNVGLVAEIAEAMGGAKHVLASSASVYGFTDQAAQETDQLNPLTAYADSKVKAERVLRMVAPHAAILRFGTLWGASPNFRTDLVVNRFAVEALTNNKIEPLSNAKRPLLHINDAADALVKVALAHKEEWSDVYNVLGENVNVFDVARKVGLAMNVDVVTDESKGDADKRSYWMGTFQNPHLLGESMIKVGDDVAMTNLASAAQKFKDQPGRVAQLKAVLDAVGITT
jgi:nucleoside-diphosphate-sugar epimerase